MRKRKGPRRPDYVGYRHPPKGTQFKPGQSGNPKGRPRGTRSVAAMLQDVVERSVTFTENGKTRRAPLLEVILQRLTADAARGDQRAVKTLFSLVNQYGQSSETKRDLDDILAEDRDILAQYMTGTPSAPAYKRGN